MTPRPLSSRAPALLPPRLRPESSERKTGSLSVSSWKMFGPRTTGAPEGALFLGLRCSSPARYSYSALSFLHGAQVTRKGAERTSPSAVQERHRRAQPRCRLQHDRVGCSRLAHTWMYMTHIRVPELVLIDVLDGAARIGATLFGELLSAVFANIGQRAIRRVARETFEHLLNLNLKFHLSRQTGALTRAIDRGTKYALSSIFSHFSFCHDFQRNCVYTPSCSIPDRPNCL